jgi:hypothetical protein
MMTPDQQLAAALERIQQLEAALVQAANDRTYWQYKANDTQAKLEAARGMLRERGL